MRLALVVVDRLRIAFGAATRPAFAGLVIALASMRAEAKPMHTALADLVKDSPTIVIARLVSSQGRADQATSYELFVERALRGTAKGTLTVKPSQQGHAMMKPGTRVVAFVNAAGEWNAYASVLAGPSLEDGVLSAAGFYDFNAHLVTPSVMTLAQLEAYVGKGTAMAWTFRGKVLVGSAKGMVASTIEVTATAPGAQVTGLPAAAGFAKPSVDVGAWPGRDASITWDRNLNRPLALTAKALGKNADGSIAVEWTPDYPELVTEADLRTYLGDAKLGHPYYVLVLERAATKIPVELGTRIGRIGTVGTQEISSTSMSPDRVIKTASSTIKLAATGFKARSGEALVEELMIGPIACVYSTKGADSPCTLRYVATKFATP
ncbi:MAG: hypothetical protein ABI867_08785 [Kofleriaceae bacterium]